MDFGAFVSILPGKDGLVHISQISHERVEKVSDKLAEGDVIKVKVLEVDRQGRIRLSMRDLDAASLGMLIALYERAVGFYASLVEINAYHQPGVEAGKRAAAEVLELQRAVCDGLAIEPVSCEELARAIDSYEQVETVFWILEHLAANDAAERLPGEGGVFTARYRRV